VGPAEQSHEGEHDQSHAARWEREAVEESRHGDNIHFQADTRRQSTRALPALRTR
jgi:hypothetical protein